MWLRTRRSEVTHTCRSSCHVVMLRISCRRNVSSDIIFCSSSSNSGSTVCTERTPHIITPSFSQRAPLTSSHLSLSHRAPITPSHPPSHTEHPSHHHTLPLTESTPHIITPLTLTQSTHHTITPSLSHRAPLTPSHPPSHREHPSHHHTLPLTESTPHIITPSHIGTVTPHTIVCTSVALRLSMAYLLHPHCHTLTPSPHTLTHTESDI